MVAILILAVDLAVMRAFPFRSDFANIFATLYLLPATAWLAASACAMAGLVRSGEAGRFAFGYVAFGLPAMLGVALIWALDAHRLDAYLNWVIHLRWVEGGLDWVDSSGLSREGLSAIGMVFELGVLGGPQMAVGLAGGVANRRVGLTLVTRRRLGAATHAGPV